MNQVTHVQLGLVRKAPKISTDSTNQGMWEQQLELASSQLVHAVIYSAWNIINDDHAALKLETIVNHSSSVECEYFILKQLKGRVKAELASPAPSGLDRELAYHVLVLELLGPSLHQLFLANNWRFSLLNVMNLEV
ncbi:hypothetical protein EDD22DRAFT_844781 [Suillus occidentalis]|nr:hypothetical protein EDD22DRAFT_844781 [Suillus occidentalis]